MINAIGYVRVSSKKQADRNLSLPEQKEQIERYCQNNKLNLINIYEETKTAFVVGRDVFAQMLSDIQHDKTIKAVITIRTDRISRNSDEFYQFEKILNHHKVQHLTITEPTINTPVGRYMNRDNQNRAILYSEELSFKAKLGLLRAWRNGQFSSGYIPRGYVKDHKTKKLIPHPEEATIIKEAFLLYAEGLYSYTAIADFLNSQKLLQRHGKEATKMTAERILKNPIYMGKLTINWTIKEGEQEFFNVASAGTLTETYTNIAIPLISEELFQETQQIRIARTKHTLKTQPIAKVMKHPYKVARCKCGRSMTVEVQKGHTYYRCTRTMPFKGSSKACHRKFIREELLEELLYTKALSHFQLTDNDLTEIKLILQEQKQEYFQNQKQKEQERKEKLSTITAQEKALTRKMINEEIPIDVYQRGIALIQADKTDLESQNFRTSEVEFEKQNNEILQWFSWVKEIAETYKVRRCDEKIQFLKNLSSNLVIDGKNIDSITLSEKFALLKNRSNLGWRRERDLNP